MADIIAVPSDSSGQIYAPHFSNTIRNKVVRDNNVLENKSSVPSVVASDNAPVDISFRRLPRKKWVQAASTSKRKKISTSDGRENILSEKVRETIFFFIYVGV